ncbi:MAG: glycosyltransferase [Lachnospiraceae bacterium]|nr:glycosyltransferase [Lachnospiraceae bacterium]
MKEEKPKRVLVIGLTERMGGVETFIRNVTIHSDPKAFRYDFLVHGADHCVFQKEIEEFYGEPGHFHFIEKYKRNPLRCLADLLKFYRERGEVYDWIHLETGAASEILYVFPFCLFLRARVIVHSHNGNGYHPLENRLFRILVNLAADRRVACSQAAAEWMFGKRKAKGALILENGIDAERFRFSKEKREVLRERYHIGDVLLIGHVGRFSEQKNHPFLLKIFREILKERPEARLLLVGKGEREEEIRALCASYRIEDSVIFAGSTDDSAPFYSAFDVFVMPSLYEGLPLAGIEAQASGLPCIFSDAIDSRIRITDRAALLPLSAGEAHWAAEILGRKPEGEREAYAAALSGQGYGMTETLTKLKKLYRQ